MPRKASGKPVTKRIERLQKNGDTYVYDVTTLYNPDKQYNEHISSVLVGKIPAGQSDMVSTRPRKTPTDSKSQASRINVGVTDILSWIGKQSGIDSNVYASADRGAAQKLISIARFWMANPDKSIRRIEEWQISHQIPYAEGLSEDSCYLLMNSWGQIFPSPRIISEKELRILALKHRLL